MSAYWVNAINCLHVLAVFFFAISFIATSVFLACICLGDLCPVKDKGGLKWLIAATVIFFFAATLIPSEKLIVANGWADEAAAQWVKER